MERMSVPKFRRLKEQARPIVMLTAYDWPSARLVDAAGVDAILVGDSLGNVVQGRRTTLPVTLDEVIYHADMVVRGTQQALVVADIPFPYCQLGKDETLRAAARLLKEAQINAVKIEGGRNRAETVAALVEAGIPVLGHCGLLPQHVLASGYTIPRDRERLFDDIKAVEQAGAFGIVLECIPAELATEVSRSIAIPTIGIGAGPGCDGQILVFHDMLGFHPNPPKHVKVYADVAGMITEAVRSYTDEVRGGTFPTAEQSF